ncbi:MAG: flagellar filament capping protein FliD [Epsilonproteobacteria bacterium]|nr:flagellar filament capping protein FliD [Campylobacterota bacterium]
MAGTINSLGIGSGVLTADVIDQLKENDKKLTVDPIQDKITLNEQKSQALDLLNSLMTTLKGSTSMLSDDTMFSKRYVGGNNSGVEVSANDGVDVQNFSISNVSLAKESVQQSGTFDSSTAVITNGSGTANLNIDGTNYSIDYYSGMSLEDFRDKINEVAGDAVTASILQVGDNEYSLVLKSDKTGTNQDITLTDNSGNLDTNLINKTYKSDTYSASNAQIASSSGSMTINVGGVSSTIDYTDGMTLEDLKNAINNDETLKDVAVANIVEESDGNFKLIINPIGSEDGADVTITDNDSGLDAGITSNASNTSGGMSEVQTAKDATFTYNGIDLTRSSNEFDDVIVGVNIKLLEDNASANISINQDTQAVKDELQNFVNSYNSMLSELNDMTLADKEEGKVGIFNGDSSIRNLGRELTRIIMSVDDKGNSLTQFGIDINQDGTLSFKPSDFDAKMDEDPQNVQEFFAGKTTFDDYGNENVVNGVFDNLNNKLNDYVGLNGSFSILTEGLQKEHSSLEDNYERSLKLLNARYDSMTQQFIEYDAIISNLNNQFAALQQQIDMAVNAKN